MDDEILEAIVVLVLMVAAYFAGWKDCEWQQRRKREMEEAPDAK